MTRLSRTKGKRIIIRFDADRRVGAGHFNRCYALGESLTRRGVDVLYCCRRFDKGIIGILKRSRNKYLLIPEKFSWKDEAEYIFNELALNISGIILDISTAYAFDDIRGIITYIKNIRKRCFTALIDGMRKNALLSKADIQVDIAVIPYFGAENLKRKASSASLYLAGPKYFIFSPKYTRLKIGKRKARIAANKILITLGGADPYGVTIKVLKAISTIGGRKIFARVVIGPCFSPWLKNKIRCFAAGGEHRLELVDSPSSLLKHMLWCDIAVTNSGLTKYEMARTGTPSLQISFNEDHAVINKLFEKNGSAKHLGVHNAVLTPFIAQEITGLLDNARQRRLMSEAGRNLLDGLGTERIADAIRRGL